MKVRATSAAVRPRGSQAEVPRRRGWKAASAALLAASLIGAPFGASASSHREAPAIADDPAADNTDVYAFVSPDSPDTVTLIASYVPLELAYGGPNFHKFADSVLYEIKVDNDGDCREDITFQWQFRTRTENGNTFLYNVGPIDAIDSPNLNVKQYYTLRMIKDGTSTTLGAGLLTAPINVGAASFPANSYADVAAEAIHTVGPSNNVKVFAGPRDDGFFVDLGAVFDLLNLRGLNNGGGVDGVACTNTHTLAIQLPINMLTADGNFKFNPAATDAVLGVYASASRRAVTVLKSDSGPATGGAWMQVSRLGLPLVNEVLIPRSHKDMYNRTHPMNDVANFGGFLLNPEPAALVNAIFGVIVPENPRLDILDVLTPNGVDACDMLRLNVAVPPNPDPSALGALGGDASGFPNGRRVYDDVTDILLRVIAGGVLVPGFGDMSPNNILGDGVYMNDVPYLDEFPYLGTPHNGFDGCGAPPQPPLTIPPQVVDVSVGNFFFDPATVQINVGDTVRWTAVGGFHTVTAGDSPTPNGMFTSGPPPLATFEFTFTDPGSFDYFCEIHPNMQGVVIVQ